jgi:hypothetical protein
MAGAKALGTVAHVKEAGRMGKAGELHMRLEYLIVGDTRMKVRGTKGKEGQGASSSMARMSTSRRALPSEPT